MKREVSERLGPRAREEQWGFRDEEWSCRDEDIA